MILIALFPWLAGLLMQEPYGYLFAVDMWAAICGVFTLMFVIPIWMIDYHHDFKWVGTGLVAYFFILNWIL